MIKTLKFAKRQVNLKRIVLSHVKIAMRNFLEAILKKSVTLIQFLVLFFVVSGLTLIILMLSFTSLGNLRKLVLTQLVHLVFYARIVMENYLKNMKIRHYIMKTFLKNVIDNK
ncbi:hypothetical protein BAAA27672_05885 [Bifidobacterium animalis subsp. animalis ATCC 27672]|nr:hypothetical protein BAAA27672_05885 [Bifidobacterium animalis subsp. animalis ATCC 27672]